MFKEPASRLPLEQLEKNFADINPPLSPAQALEDWLRGSATRYGPVFRKVTRWGTVEPKTLGADAIRRA